MFDSTALVRDSPSLNVRYPLVLGRFYSRHWAMLESAYVELENLLWSHATGAIGEEEVAANVAAKRYGVQRNEYINDFLVPDLQSVAVVPVYGPLIDKYASGSLQVSGVTTPQVLAKLLDQAAANPNISTIVLDFDSPGGTVTGTLSAAEAVTAAKEKLEARGGEVVAVVNEMMCSAAQWIGAMASRTVISSNGMAGSIGVISKHYDYRGFLAQRGVKATILRSAPRKALGHPEEAMEGLVLEDWMHDMNYYHAQFVQAISNARGMSKEQVPATGQVFIGQEAVDAGLADSLGTMRDVLEDLRAKRAPRPSANAARADAGEQATAQEAATATFSHLEAAGASPEQAQAIVEAPVASSQPFREDASLNEERSSSEEGGDMADAASQTATNPTAPTATAAPALDALSPEMRAHVAALEARVKKSEADAAAAAEAASSLRSDLRLRDLKAYAASKLAGLTGSEDEKAQLLAKLEEKGGAELYAQVTAMLEAASAQVAKAQKLITKELGASGEKSAAQQQLETIAAEIEAKEGKSKAESMQEAARRNPELYERSREENR
jgi:signal peptide peptidase SppA